MTKVVENTFRAVNIAFANELAKICRHDGMDVYEIIRICNMHPRVNILQPGPGVGGHCISVDPYYLIEKAKVYGILPRVMTNARRLNDSMGTYVAEQVIKLMNKKGVLVKDSNILMLGITFKENCPDIRNTKVVDIYHTLSEYTQNISIIDPWADAGLVAKEYGISISKALPQGKKFDAVILCVAHSEFTDYDMRSLVNDNGVIYDVKGILPKDIIDGRL